MLKLNTLTQEVINQIAAGEVIERPSSVVKELIDNSIDAKATEIKVKLEQGGIKSIEVTDNGIGIDRDNLKNVFLPHTTSKLENIDDLNSILTMGFRGEALSTIQSVAKVKIISIVTDSEIGYELDISDTKSIPKKSSKEVGTTIFVTDLFYNTPARLKFLKTPETEYRKIYDVILKYAICYPNIKFQFINDSKTVFNLFNEYDKTIALERIKELFKNDFLERMLEVKSVGSGVSIAGYIAHPLDIAIKTTQQYLFINNRPVWDYGIAKSVAQGYSRFIPQGMKVPYFLKLNIDPSLLDINVHPRKEEIRFQNPYRIYMAVENAVSEALKTITKDQINVFAHSNKSDNDNFSKNNLLFDRSNAGYTTGHQTKELRFDKKPSDYNIRTSLNFSKQLLNTDFDIQHMLEVESFKQIFQIFNKYIVIEFENEIWIIDQHAGAERINFEKLLKQQSGSLKDVQVMLIPIEIDLNFNEISIIKENIEILNKLGFEIELKEDKVLVKSIPAFIDSTSIDEIFNSFEEEIDVKKDVTMMGEDIIATVACHGSVRSGQSLTVPECIEIFNSLKKCENPFSCPHGRPAVWKLKRTEIDTNFLRTY